MTIRRFIKWLYAGLIPALLTCMMLVGLWMLGQRMEPRVQDLLMQWTARPASDSPVVLVMIDDESVRRLGPDFGTLPWPRKTYIEIFKRLQAQHPAIIGFDGHFMNLSQAEDREVFQQMQAFPHLVTGLALTNTPMDYLNTGVPEYYHLNLGVVTMWQDADGVIRNLKPFHQSQTAPSRMGFFPSLSVAAAYDYLNERSTKGGWLLNLENGPKNRRILRVFPEKAPNTGVRLPLQRDGSFRLRWYRTMGTEGYRHSHPIVPVWQVFEAGAAPDLSGKIVLLGSSSSIYRDYHPSPMALRHLGTDIHATAIDNILGNQTIRSLPDWGNWLIISALFGLIFFLRLVLRNFTDTLLYTLGSMIIYLWIAYSLFNAQGLAISVVTAELFMIVALIAASTYRIISGEQRLAHAEQSLTQLVSPDVYREIQRMRRSNANLLEAGGQRLEITSMFVDIRNFTAMAETLPPNEVTDLLNRFYSAVVAVVFDHRGTVDKFMGDGILVMFGAPIPDALHADNALAAAREILSVTERLATDWQTEKGWPLEVGVSLNSGPAFVGFLGPQNKLEYTAVGDTVNICIRLQQQTKEYHTRLILSEHTMNALSVPPHGLHALGEITPKGREGRLTVFGLPPASEWGS